MGIFYDNGGTGKPRKGGVRYDDNKGTKNFYAESLCDPDTGNGSTSEAYSPKETYIRGIREEWGITLPTAEWEIYNEAAGSSFAGKGVRYHVFRYQDAASAPESSNPAQGKEYAGGTESRRTASGIWRSQKGMR